MKKPLYTIRNYLPSDLEALTRLFKEEKRRESPADRLNRPGISPEKDVFIAEQGDNLVGYAELEPELGIDRVILRCWVHPDHRRKGLATELLARSVRRAEEMGVKAVHVSISQDNSIARNGLPKLGFKYVRRYLELVLDMNRIPQQDLEEAAKGCRKLRSGEEEKLADIQNRAFAGHWGYNPNSTETITYAVNLSRRSPEDIVLACEEDAITGYCWTEIIDVAVESGEEKRGTINMIGTDPDYRGKGLGKKALLAGLAYLKSKGVKTIGLSVDSTNEVAYELYRTIGFTQQGSTLWYEKKLGGINRNCVE